MDNDGAELIGGLLPLGLFIAVATSTTPSVALLPYIGANSRLQSGSARSLLALICPILLSSCLDFESFPACPLALIAVKNGLTDLFKFSVR